MRDVLQSTNKYILKNGIKYCGLIAHTHHIHTYICTQREAERDRQRQRFKSTSISICMIQLLFLGKLCRIEKLNSRNSYRFILSKNFHRQENIFQILKGNFILVLLELMELNSEIGEKDVALQE